MYTKNFVIASLLTLVIVRFGTVETVAPYPDTDKKEELRTAPEIDCVESTEDLEMTPLERLQVKVIEPAREVQQYLELTDEEKRLFATLLYHEARGESYECQLAVGSTVLNRMEAFDMTLREVIFQKYNGFYQFSPAPLLERKDENGDYVWEPYDEQWQAVDELCKNGPTLPYYVLYFRADYYFDWAEPYCSIGDTYFSYMEMNK